MCVTYLQFVIVLTFILGAACTRVLVRNVTGATTTDIFDVTVADEDDITTVNYENNPEILDEKVYNSTPFPNGDDSFIMVRTLGIIESSGNLPMDEAKIIMDKLQKGNLSFSSVSLMDYGSDDAYSFKKAVKELREENPDAVIGPYNWPYAVAAEHLRIPYFVTSQMPLDQKLSPFLIQLFPDPHIFARAAEDMLRYYRLTRVVVFHDSVAGEIILERLSRQPQMEVTGFLLNRKSISNLREQLKIVRSKYYTAFISVLNAKNVQELLEQALSLSMFSSTYKWLLVNMHLFEYSLEQYVDSQANITVLRLMMDSSSNSCALGAGDINLRRAVFHDAVRLQAHISQADVMSLHGHMGVTMRGIVRNLEIDGCTGHLKFSRNATREESFLQIMALEGYRSGLNGTWRSLPDDLKRRVEPFKSFSSVSRMSENVFGDKPLRITVRQETPFLQKRGEKSVDENHLEFEGFVIDILLEMVKLLGFTFKISEVPDGKFGSLKETGWTGMIRQLVDGEADIALAPFQMTTQRAQVVDFTKPFMTKGTTVVVKRPESKLWMFQFLSPFSNIVWCAIFVAFVSASLVLFTVSRVNSDRHAKYTHNLRESFWYIWGTLLRGSLCGSPHAISSRIVSSAWWFFCLILSSVYTANLAAFLTITISDVNINSAQDLALQEYFDYGTVEGSQTAIFFNHTRMTLYSRMWAYMSVLSPTSMSRNTEVGFNRVKQGRYAFIWDSPIIRHTISNDCELMEIGSPFDLKGYGFAYQKDAAYGDKLSWALLKLQDDGILYKLERKWFRPQFCPSPSATTESLDLETVAGMYVVILSGALMSILVCLLQYCYSQLRRRRKSHMAKRVMKENEGICTQALDEGFREHTYWQKQPEREEPAEDTKDEITYANHSPLRFRSVEEWT